MRKLILYSPILLLFSFMADNFRTEQKKFEKVKTAYTEKEAVVKALFTAKGLDLSSSNIFIRVFKKDALLEVWANSAAKKEFTLINSYTICSSSGGLGPKRKQGDMQVPEGFYEINHFNPLSSYYLSLGVSYPNASDRKLGGKGDLGGAIYIHGDCVTIGCMPLTDDKIKEVYVMAVEARAGGQQKIQVHIFPAKLDDKNAQALYAEASFKDNKPLIDFWKNIADGYKYFETNKKLPAVSVDASGKYIIK